MTLHYKFQQLRSRMKAADIDAYIIPSSDPHQSEYVAGYWKCRAWISGFTGSAGTVIVTQDHVGLWTDSRYFIQAEKQLHNTEVVLHKLNVPLCLGYKEWLCQNLPDGSSIGCDGRLFSVTQVRSMQKNFAKKNFSLVFDTDLISGIWNDRPPLPNKPVFDHALKYAGKSRGEKMAEIQEKMGEVTHYLLTTLDDIAWLFNLRSSDVECNPVFYAYAILKRDSAILFTGPGNISHELEASLRKDGVEVRPYHEVQLFPDGLASGQKVRLDPATTNYSLFNALPKDAIAEDNNLVAAIKAIKNPVEIAHFRSVMKKDAVALVRLFMWLEQTLHERSIAETEVAETLIELRSEQNDYYGESFDAIVGYNANGAVVHYKPEPGVCSKIEASGILLIDSGGQYLDGTTDITRTIALSEPNTQQKKDFTLVLKGYIQLETAKFPAGTTGIQLDTLARFNLWKSNLNYGHGTGHGVGYFLNVHEGPQGFSPTPNTLRANSPIEAGSVTSNEPGLYRTDQYGIRIENLVLCVQDEETAFGKFMRFEPLTLFPIDHQLIEKSMLAPDEIAWLDNYHTLVYEAVSPLLTNTERTWLQEKCKAI